jgi:hypothetical protein
VLDWLRVGHGGTPLGLRERNRERKDRIKCLNLPILLSKLEHGRYVCVCRRGWMAMSSVVVAMAKSRVGDGRALGDCCIVAGAPC